MGFSEDVRGFEVGTCCRLQVRTWLTAGRAIELYVWFEACMNSPPQNDARLKESAAVLVVVRPDWAAGRRLVPRRARRVDREQGRRWENLAATAAAIQVGRRREGRESVHVESRGLTTPFDS